jgi:hypothetical protein
MIIIRLIKKFSDFYETQMFITTISETYLKLDD